MSEIVLAVSLWITVSMHARDPYYSKRKILLGFLAAFAAGYTIFAFLQFSTSEIAELRSFPLYMAVWMPLFTWAYNARTLAVIEQHGEASLHRKYGAPKLNLDILEDQNLAKKIRLSQFGLWAFIVVFIVERILTYVKVST